MDEIKNQIKKISNHKVRNYLLDYGFFPEDFVFPQCFKAHLSKLNVPQIDWRDKKFLAKFPVDENPISIRVHKNNNYGWRRFTLINPWHYIKIVDELTSDKNWKLLKKILCKKRGVISYSLPIFNGNRTKNGIEYWRKMESDILENSIGYGFLVNADVKGFYQSIYTHSIAWAIHTKKNIRRKKHAHDLNFLGNRLDKLFQYSNDRQTKGIFVGPLVSEIIAEIIMLAIDEEIYKEIKKNKIECHICRFRDDYRILAHSDADSKFILNIISDKLSTFNLELNDDKTEFFDIISDGTIRPWVKEITQIISSMQIIKKGRSEKIKNINIVFSLLIDIQKKFSQSNVLMTFIGRLKMGEESFDKYILNKAFDKKEARQLMSQVLSFASINIGTFRDVIRIITKIIDFHFKLKRDKNNFLKILLKNAINNHCFYETLWIIYLFKYFGIQKQFPRKKIAKEAAKFVKNPGYPLLLALLNNKQIFKKIDNKYLIDNNFKKQEKNKIIQKSIIFSYSG